MIPAGSMVFNTTQIQNSISSISACGSADELQAITTNVFASLSSVKSQMTSELANANAMLTLLTPPSANLTSVVTWITGFTTGFLTPLTLPTVTYAAQLTELSTQVAHLESAITAAQVKFPNVSITIPSI